MGAAASSEDVFAASEESKRALAAQYGEVLSATITGSEYVEAGAGEMRGSTEFVIAVKTERGEPTVVVRCPARLPVFLQRNLLMAAVKVSPAALP